MTDRLETADDGIAQLPAEITPAERRLTAAEFQHLTELPPELEWFKNLSKGTQRIYKIAVGDFMRFTGIVRPEEFRIVTRAHNGVSWNTVPCPPVPPSIVVP